MIVVIEGFSRHELDEIAPSHMIFHHGPPREIILLKLRLAR